MGKRASEGEIGAKAMHREDERGVRTTERREERGVRSTERGDERGVRAAGRGQGRRQRELNIVMVTHGLTMRVFLMRWFRWTVAQFEGLSNPSNCEVRVMELGSGGKYSLAKRHSEYELFSWGLTPAMIAGEDDARVVFRWGGMWRRRKRDLVIFKKRGREFPPYNLTPCCFSHLIPSNPIPSHHLMSSYLISC